MKETNIDQSRIRKTESVISTKGNSEFGNLLLFKCLVIHVLSLEQVFRLPLSPGVHLQTRWCSLDSLYSSPVLPLELHPQPTSGSRTSSPSPLPPRSLWKVHQEGCTLEPLMTPMQGGTREGRPMRLQEWG